MEAHDEGRCDPSSKEVYLWGINYSGCLGFEEVNVDKMITDPRKLSVPQIMWTQVACGPLHTVAVSSNGELFTWGYGGFGILGHGDEKDRSVPPKVEIPGGEKVVKVACGTYHTAVVTRTGKLFTWYVSC